MYTGSALLVDGSSLLVRAFFATAYSGRLMRTASGVYTNGVFGFLNMLLGAWEQFRPSHVCVAWDVSRDTFRRELYPAYKGTRGELPLELLPQFDLAWEVLEAMGVTQYQDKRYEADDIIGTMSALATEKGHRALVLTGDRDALQLVSPQVTVLITKKGVTELDYFTPEFLLEKWGVHSHQIVDLKGLMGDTSDNIPGVPGVGEKTATKLIQEHGSMELLYENIDQVKGKLKDKLIENREIAFLSKKLATIVTDMPLGFTWEDCVAGFAVDQAKDKLSELELTRFLKIMDRLNQSAS